MRASTLFAVILSLLIGLGVAAAARYAGLFDKAPDRPLETGVQQKPAPIRVLVAAQNLYPEIHVLSGQVTVRELRDTEQDFYKANKSKLLPALPSAAHLRMPKKNIVPDTILTNDLFEDPAIPPPPGKGLPVDQRLVNVAVSKQKSAGGVLRVGDIVDVLLTARVSVAGKGDSLSTAVVAKGCKIVMKRDNIFTVLRSDPANKPIEFTLQTNNYRAALIEFVSYKGIISLQPAPGPAMMLTSMEDQMKINEMNQGSYAVSDADLAAIFKITPAIPPTPPDRTRVITSGGGSRWNTFASHDPPPPGVWFNFGPPGSASALHAPSSKTAVAKSTGELLVNPETGMSYDPKDKNDPNNPGCVNCKKKKESAAEAKEAKAAEKMK